MVKKYQIFISSTYEDLKNERREVQNAILSMYHFPIGMEMFSAADEEQWNIIKENIDSSDYYILIVANRYGSVMEEGEDKGISYTEREYHYAKQKKIPVLAFLIDESVSRDLGYADEEAEIMMKLNNFKKEIKKGRTVEFWKNRDDLRQKVVIALYKQLNKNNRLGWVRLTDSAEKKLKLCEGNVQYGAPVGKAYNIPMYFQEDQNMYHFLADAKLIVFCARTGKILLNGHYNILRELIRNGGKLVFLTSLKSNLLYDDEGEHAFNKKSSIQTVKNLHKINRCNVECKTLDLPPNLTILYVKTGEDTEFLEVNFQFQTNLKGKHPIFRIEKDSPFFDTFYNEIMNFYSIGTELNLDGDLSEVL